jgi:hypothetical protein
MVLALEIEASLRSTGCAVGNSPADPRDEHRQSVVERRESIGELLKLGKWRGGGPSVGERHLRHVLLSYMSYYNGNGTRTHLKQGRADVARRRDSRTH